LLRCLHFNVLLCMYFTRPHSLLNLVYVKWPVGN
jgi:hypothetical protein